MEALVATVARAFGLTAAHVEIAGRGVRGCVWRVADRSGRELAVKDLGYIHDETAVRREVEFQEAASRAGVPLARPVPTVAGGYLVMADGLHFRAYDWLAPAHRVRVPASRSVAAAVGAALARIHVLALPPWAGVDDWYMTPPGGDRWARLADEVSLLRPAWRAPFERELADVVGLGEIGRRTPPVEAVVCHRDVIAQNTIATASGLAIVDWDNAGAMWPSSEAGAALLDWGRRPRGGVDEPAVRALVDAYRDAGGDFSPDDTLFGVGVTIRLNWLALTVEGALHSTTAEGRGFMARRAAVALARPLGRLRRDLDHIMRVVQAM